MFEVSLQTVEQVCPGVYTFWFKPNKKFDYAAGQFVEMLLPHADPDNRGTRRWFTLSSAPSEKLIAITTKKVASPSSFKQRMFALYPGDTVSLSAAMGDFVLPRDKKIPLVFVVFGIGVTPVRAMTKWLLDTGEQRNLTLLYTTKNPSTAAFRPLFDSQLLHVQYYSSKKHLLVTDILVTAAKLDNPLVYLSGPEESVEYFVEELKNAGIKAPRLVTDYFPGYGSD